MNCASMSCRESILESLSKCERGYRKYNGAVDRDKEQERVRNRIERWSLPLVICVTVRDVTVRHV